MDDSYHREFPPAARAKVKAKKILAARNFEEAKQSLRRVTEVEAALRTYILQVFLSFAEEAFALGRQGVWSADQVEGESREFLRRTAIEAGAEKGFDPSGHPLPTMISNWSGAILPEVQRELEKSPEWKRFTDGLLELAELQAGRTTAGSRPGTVETVPLADMNLAQGTGVPAATAAVQQAACPDLGEAARPADTESTAQPHAAEFVEGRGARPLLNVDLINQWIIAEGYNNTELAQKLHLSLRAVTSMRKNQSYHGRRAVQKLANLMGRDATELYLP
jgi:hypothetical protein